MIVLPPAPAVPPDEIFGRINRVREAMSRARIGALLLTSQNNVEYFSGYRTLSWTSNTRPVFLVIGRKEFVLIGSTTEERNLATTHRLFRAQLYRGFIENALPVAVDCLCRAVAHMEPLVALDYGRDTFGRGSIALLSG
jgi:Xaa-Pro dipeptidase